MNILNNLTEGRKMFLCVMVVFAIYAAIFILFEDVDRYASPFDEASDWHLLAFSLVVMAGLGFVMHRYAQRMDKRIQREQQLRQGLMRRELTQNISHELKTPVSSILGYMETLREHPEIDADTRGMFVERSYQQARRLTSLLQDLSTLNRMDYAPELLTKVTLDVSEVVSSVVEETRLALQKRGMTLRNCLPEDIIVQGNASLIYSIFRNLMENAINYAGEGTIIEMSAVETPRQWQFTFSDNGVGVSASHLPRLFERFYRVDKGRSRELGGTGLGLAIVKNAVLHHGGTISAHQAEGGGLLLKFSLSKD